MRKLNASQKRMLKSEFNRCAEYGFYVDLDELGDEFWNKLESLNDYETLWQDAQRFLSDLAFERTVTNGW